MNKILCPSILSANFLNLSKDLEELKKSDITRLHVDIMDGNFVPNITFGPDQVKFIKDNYNFYLDCHLMINNLDVLLDKFIDLGVSCITIHYEAHNHIYRLLDKIKKNNIDCGIAINPGTSIYSIVELLPIVDKVLIMTVNPGFGGQKFIDSMESKISLLNKMLKESNNEDKVIQVDGGINLINIKKVYDLGARDIVVGSYIFNGDIKSNIVSLMNEIEMN